MRMATQVFMNKWFIAIILAACGLAGAEPLPPAANRAVDFEKEVVPIFQSTCVNCHSSGKTEADLSIETREKLLEGGASDPAIVPGKSADSLLIQLVSGQDADRIMPKKGKRLTPEQIGILRAWIDQGAKWPDKFVIADPSKPKPAPLEPREVKIPAAHDGLTNPIDLLLEPYFAEHKITPGKIVEDRVFARRVYLDVTGLLPPPEELEKFVADSSPDKRTNLVRQLLDDNQRYATHWLSFWNDLLRNDYKGTGYIDGGREQITRWLYFALADNKPYDKFVADLITGVKGASGFTKGIVWRGVVNSAQTPPMQAAQNIGQVFMGVNLKCASCHDSFINQWKLTDSYGLAGVFAEKAPEMERCTKPLGKTAAMKFLYPELGEIDQNASRDQRIAQLAGIVTSQKNGRLTRTIVNRLWQRLMGRGLIEPVDEMDQKPWNSDVLDALAWQLAEQHYDLKKLIETIVLSRAYQLSAMSREDENAKEFVFSGPTLKRMSAEQFVDAVATVTGVWTGQQQAALTDNAERYGQARWIWNDRDANKAVPPGKVYFRRALEIKSAPKILSAVIAVDNQFTLFINGKQVAEGAGWPAPVTVDLLPHVQVGRNMIAVIAENTSTAPNPAGFWFHLQGAYDGPAKGKQQTIVLNSNPSWKWSKDAPEEWTTLEFDDKSWQGATRVGDVGSAPWNLLAYLPTENPLDHPAEVRASLCAANPLMTALGRPNRDQVNTVRPSAATTLMALELTNGGTLADALGKAAKAMSTEKDVRAEELIQRVFLRAMGRAPSDSELAAVKDVVGANVKDDGVEDFLWAVVMLPEFQLIR